MDPNAYMNQLESQHRERVLAAAAERTRSTREASEARETRGGRSREPRRGSPARPPDRGFLRKTAPRSRVPAREVSAAGARTP